MYAKTMRPSLRQLSDRHNLAGAEIGVYHGENAALYFKELNIKHVFLIDPYVGYESYSPTKVGLKDLVKAEEMAHKKLCNYKQRITWIKKKSSEAAKLITDASLDFVYIDGNHSYISVTEDVLLYYPKIKKGGLLSGHDYDIESVKEAVDNFIKNRDLYLYTENGSGMELKFDWWTWKS